VGDADGVGDAAASLAVVPAIAVLHITRNAMTNAAAAMRAALLAIIRSPLDTPQMVRQ
jgi:hypothetical protein